MSAYPRRIGIFGATSDIAAAFARRSAVSGDDLVLIGRDGPALEQLAANLIARGARSVSVQEVDLISTSGITAATKRAWQTYAGLDVALVAYGTLPDQQRLIADAEAIEGALVVNFVSPVILLNELAAKFEAARHGTLVMITSVAGNRGRQSNYIYGAAKGGLQRYLEGLRHRLFKAGVRVIDVRPGLVRTKMTAFLSTKGWLWATPEKVAADISSAIDRRAAVLYTPWYWRGIMAVVCALPRSVFHRTKL
jgi:decaprenylphospho-beta-D-erythro-pentofuranosid-2-ulose 2-reductase